MAVIPNPYPQPGSSGGAEALTSGEALFERVAFTQQQALTGGTLALTYWHAVKTETVNHVITGTGSQAASGLSYAAIGLYTISPAGALTLAASTSNLSGTLWAGTFTEYTAALTAGFPKVAGTRYAMGLLAVGTTPPNLWSQFVSFSDAAPILAGTLGGQTTLPATIPAASVSTGSFNIAWQALVTP